MSTAKSPREPRAVTRHGLQLRAALEILGMTQEQLGARAKGVGQRTVEEASRSGNVRVSKLEALAAGIGWDWWLLSEAEGKLITELRVGLRAGQGKAKRKAGKAKMGGSKGPRKVATFPPRKTRERNEP